LTSGLDDEPSWEAVLASEPGAREYLSEAQFDTACRALADFVDIKSTYTYGHSPHVAELASEAARRGGLPPIDVTSLRRAALLHELGKTGISIGIWDKPGALTDREREQVRLHPYYTERILARPTELARLGALAAAHHERLDGSGYHRGVTGSQLTPAARILIAANLYQTKSELRPHRSALTPDQAAAELRREVKAGRLDGEAVNHVLAAAGQPVPSVGRDYVAGLSEREIEVLRLLARGQSMKAIAAQLSIAPKTVDSHIQHIYTKIGVSTRAGATLFAMEHNLVT
jgi:HD-GYP domain-containing protein (c-di-GMP phosphodiesterase class II)